MLTKKVKYGDVFGKKQPLINQKEKEAQIKQLNFRLCYLLTIKRKKIV